MYCNRFVEPESVDDGRDGDDTNVLHSNKWRITQSYCALSCENGATAFPNNLLALAK